MGPAIVCTRNAKFVRIIAAPFDCCGEGKSRQDVLEYFLQEFTLSTRNCWQLVRKLLCFTSLYAVNKQRGLAKIGRGCGKCVQLLPHDLDRLLAHVFLDW